MTKIKFCGLSRTCDIKTVNELKPEYIGFVFAKKSKRFVSPYDAKKLKSLLIPDIKAVGVFVNESPQTVADILNQEIIDIAQLHGSEDESYIRELRRLTKKPIIKAFRIKNTDNLQQIENSSADYVLLDSGAGTGTVFDWDIIKHIKRPYFLAGGLSVDNAENAVNTLHPYAVDVSSGIETDGVKDKFKMAAFAAAVRKEKKQ